MAPAPSTTTRIREPPLRLEGSTHDRSVRGPCRPPHGADSSREASAAARRSAVSRPDPRLTGTPRLTSERPYSPCRTAEQGRSPPPVDARRRVAHGVRGAGTAGQRRHQPADPHRRGPPAGAAGAEALVGREPRAGGRPPPPDAAARSDGRAHPSRRPGRREGPAYRRAPPRPVRPRRPWPRSASAPEPTGNGACRCTSSPRSGPARHRPGRAST